MALETVTRDCTSTLVSPEDRTPAAMAASQTELVSVRTNPISEMTVVRIQHQNARSTVLGRAGSAGSTPPPG